MALVKNKPFKFENISIAAGEHKTIDLSIGQLYTHTPVIMPVHVFNGKYSGPVMFVAAAIHGDELNGIEIIQRLLRLPSLKRIRGTLIAIPIVNVLSVVHQSRYLPDRRDLNRSFPGSRKGSLASRMANKFMTKVVKHCDFGIDLHTGAIHRSNLPQIRASLDNKAMIEFAKAFNAPVVLNSKASPSTLRGACAKLGSKITKGQQLGTVSSPYVDQESDVKATISGVLVGKTNIPLVHGGDALFHVAKVSKNIKAAAKIKAFKSRHLKSGEEE